MMGRGSARPAMREAWAEMKAVKSAAFDALELLGKYRRILRSLNEDCPNVPRADVPDYIDGWDDLQDAIARWKEQHKRAERAVREAHERLVSASAKAKAAGVYPTSLGFPSLDPNLLAPTRPSATSKKGAAFL